MGRETVFLHLQQEEEQEEELGWSQATRPTRTTLSPSAQVASQRIGPAWRKPQTLLTAATACRPTNFLSLLLFRTERQAVSSQVPRPTILSRLCHDIKLIQTNEWTFSCLTKIRDPWYMHHKYRNHDFCQAQASLLSHYCSFCHLSIDMTVHSL